MALDMSVGTCTASSVYRLESVRDRIIRLELNLPDCKTLISKLPGQNVLFVELNTLLLINMEHPATSE